MVLRSHAATEIIVNLNKGNDALKLAGILMAEI